MSDKEKQCPACGTGQSGMHRHTFVSEGKIISMGYDVEAFACLDCGHISFYLPPFELKELKIKLNKQ